MLTTLHRMWTRIEAALQQFYARSPGCCATGGLTRSQLEGRPKHR